MVHAQPDAADGDGHTSVGFEVIQERADKGSVEVVHVELGWGCSGGVVHEAEQQLERVPIGGDADKYQYVDAGLAWPR